MNQPALDISLYQLSASALFVIAAALISFFNKLQLERSLLIGSLRCVLQLLAIGYMLTVIFALKSFWLVLLLFMVMLGFAARIIRGNVAEDQIPFIMPAFITMFLIYTLVSAYVSGVVVGADPWWRPQYFIPIAGMVVGNSMTALGLALDRFLGDLRGKREEVEMRLCYGATSAEASRPLLRDALKAGMLPSINSLAGVGLVFLPGMMTGQILAGSDPMLAVRYQIVVMFMIVAATALSLVIVLSITRKRCFGPAHRLLLEKGR
jgi:putative ABC transport system permease protein